MGKGGLRELDISQLFENTSDIDKFLIEAERAEIKFIKNLIKLRISKDVTQKELARRSGLTQQAISRIETYGNKPNLKNLIKYLLALNIDINKIF